MVTPKGMWASQCTGVPPGRGFERARFANGIFESAHSSCTYSTHRNHGLGALLSLVTPHTHGLAVATLFCRWRTARNSMLL